MENFGCSGKTRFLAFRYYKTRDLACYGIVPYNIDLKAEFRRASVLFERCFHSSRADSS